MFVTTLTTRRQPYKTLYNCHFNSPVNANPYVFIPMQIGYRVHECLWLFKSSWFQNNLLYIRYYYCYSYIVITMHISSTSKKKATEIWVNHNNRSHDNLSDLIPIHSQFYSNGFVMESSIQIYWRIVFAVCYISLARKSNFQNKIFMDSLPSLHMTIQFTNFMDKICGCFKNRARSPLKF